MDCAGGRFGDFGCNGGLPLFGMAYSDTQPVMSNATYPYKAEEQECAYDAGQGLVSANGYTLIDENRPELMQAALSHGPITVAIHAGAYFFKFYKSGIFHHDCSSDLDHAITLVGYVNENDGDLPYWIVRNSWGPDWGEDGYFRFAITGGDGICGINIEPTMPNVYYLNTYSRMSFVLLSMFGLALSLWPLIKLSWCKGEN